MATSDDLSGLFLSPPLSDPGTQAFRQATVVAFDKNTGANTVNLAGALLTNLPLLNIGDTVNINVGDSVILMKMNNAMAILGRVIQAGGSQLNSTAIETKGSNPSSPGPGFAVTTGFVVQASGVVTVPVWANTASVFAYCWGSAFNSTAVAGEFMYLQTSLVISGFGTFPGAAIQSASIPATSWGFAFAGGSRTAQPVTPGGTVTVQGAVRSNTGAWALNANNVIQVESVMTFYKI